MGYITATGKFGHIININEDFYECHNSTGIYKFHCIARNGKKYSYVGFSDMLFGRVRSHLENFGVSYHPDKKLWNLFGAYKSPVNHTHNLCFVYDNPTFFDTWYFDKIDFDSDLTSDKYYLQEGRETDRSIENKEILLNVFSPPGGKRHVASHNLVRLYGCSELNYDFRQDNYQKSQF